MNIVIKEPGIKPKDKDFAAILPLYEKFSSDRKPDVIHEFYDLYGQLVLHGDADYSEDQTIHLIKASVVEYHRKMNPFFWSLLPYYISKGITLTV